MLTKEGVSSPSLLFIAHPGFRPQIPESGNSGTIIQIVLSDFLVDLFHYQPLDFIGGFLRRSSDCRLLLPDVVMQLVEDSILSIQNYNLTAKSSCPNWCKTPSISFFRSIEGFLMPLTYEAIKL